MGGEQQPALHMEAVIVPFDGFGFAPHRSCCIVDMSDLAQVHQVACPNLGGILKRRANQGDLVVARDGNAHLEAAGADGTGKREVIVRGVFVGAGVVDEQVRGTATELRDAQLLIVEPRNPGGAGVAIRGRIFRLAAACRHHVDVAAGRTLVRHESADERDPLAIGDQRGTAICRPCSDPVTVCGSRIAVGSWFAAGCRVLRSTSCFRRAGEPLHKRAGKNRATSQTQRHADAGA